MTRTRGWGGVYGLAPGEDFAKKLLEGLEARLEDEPPEAWASVTLILNSGRLLRRLRSLMDAGPPRLLPRMMLVSDLGSLPGFPGVPQAQTGIGLKLDLAELIERLRQKDQNLVPRHAVYDLADSLAALLDEIEGEGVEPKTLSDLDLGLHAAHWARSKSILEASFAHFGASVGMLPGGEARRRRIIGALINRWETAPPSAPVIIAGSTGSRGATQVLIRAVAGLPVGAVVLPGFDFELDETDWHALDRGAYHPPTNASVEDHPQFRYRDFLASIGLNTRDVDRWAAGCPPDLARNRLISLSLCPAPVTDKWRAEGPKLQDPIRATSRVSLLEAASPEAEAQAIALRLRHSVENGLTAAVITPDRVLTRQVTAALDRWNIHPDDSGGVPLSQTPPGRLLRMVAAWRASPQPLSALLATLKHPLTARSGERGSHLLAARELELWLRRRRAAEPTQDEIAAWAAEAQPSEMKDWAAWLQGMMTLADGSRGHARLSDHIASHISLTQKLCTGPTGDDHSALWQEHGGKAAADAMSTLEEAAQGRDALIDAASYADLLRHHLGSAEVQNPRLGHPLVMIWGTLEARLQGADLVILAGLNEGIWPAAPSHDIWLNRRMRLETGLHSPDREIGLAAHDYQQAVAAPEVMLTRSIRNADAETVPSRWLNRLTNLLGGLGESGAKAKNAMLERGNEWSSLACRVAAPVAQEKPSRRPSPCPPVHARPRAFFVTDVEKLIRDPYAIYARHVLRLRRLDPLVPRPDAARRGTALHAVMEEFLKDHETWSEHVEAARDALFRAAASTLPNFVSDPSIRALWEARLLAASHRLIAGEAERMASGQPVLLESKGSLTLGGPDFTLSAKPDRVDRLENGEYALFDYKSTPPSDATVTHFEKQLPLEAAMLEGGAFAGLLPAPVAQMGFIALGPTQSDVMLKLDKHSPQQALAEFRRLIEAYLNPDQGFTARRAVQKTGISGDYDQLARYGEWGLTQTPVIERVGDGHG